MVRRGGSAESRRKQQQLPVQYDEEELFLTVQDR